MATGTVKAFNDERGFGFITPDEEARDLFVYHSKELIVHCSGISDECSPSLAEGVKVCYEAVSSDKGPKAVDVHRM